METVDHVHKTFVLCLIRHTPDYKQGTREAETFGQIVLVNQFLAGLYPKNWREWRAKR